MNEKTIAIVGAGIYGCCIALRMAKAGLRVSLFDPLSILRAASANNQFRIHAGYHYPRSTETVREVLEVRDEFLTMFQSAIVSNTDHYYAIPFEGSRTSTEEFEKFCESFELPLTDVRPTWMNFDFIDRCYKVVEHLYDPDAMRSFLSEQIARLDINFIQETFDGSRENEFDYVVYATYGMSGGHRGLFKSVKFQVAEKTLIRLPTMLQRKALVVIDGPFTAFDSYKGGEFGLFGSARFTNHWTTNDPSEPVPDEFRNLLNKREFERVSFSRFEDFRQEAVNVTPGISTAEYIGSKFTLRVVEDDPEGDRRILKISSSDDRVFRVFSGKVVSALKAGHLIEQAILK